jgi:NDP-sugar pyrophosphorylase family protein
MIELKVCILTAGKGTRTGELGRVLNKALHPIDGKAVISHIIDKFPANTKFVIGLGYLGDQVKAYLSIAHSGFNIEYVQIENFDGTGSGPGLSLLLCKEKLHCPFYFVSCDTIWEGDINCENNQNWLGVSKVSKIESKNYCNVVVDDSYKVVALHDKQMVDESENHYAFTGLCKIVDFDIFWEGLTQNKQVDGEHQISNGLSHLIRLRNVFIREVDWTDVGDEYKYKIAISKYENYDFSKKNESLYIHNKKVIKFFSDKGIVNRRVQKVKDLTDIFPEISNEIGQFYSYDFQPGKTLYQCNDPEIFKKLLEWLDAEVWIKRGDKTHLMASICNDFYQKKTMDRIDLYKAKYPNYNNNLKINGKSTLAIHDLLKMIPWQSINDGEACFIHGDLQFDNILFNSSTNKFTLLDWRHEFGGEVEFGDLYYDLAKLYGGIILNYDLIKENKFHYDESSDIINFDFLQRYQGLNYASQLDAYIRSKNLDLKKVKILVGMIYINMSPLHHYPFDKMLFALGSEILQRELCS